MLIGNHFAEFLHIGPYPLFAGVENVRPVDMDHNPGFRVALRETIAGHMSAFVDDENLMASFGERPPDHRAAKTCADNAISHLPPPMFKLHESNR